MPAREPQCKNRGHPKRDFVTERVAAGQGGGHLTNVNVNGLQRVRFPFWGIFWVLEVSGSSLRRLAASERGSGAPS